jgi:hypothetical protein
VYGFEAFFELEDGALEKVRGDGDGQAEGARDTDWFVVLEISRLRPAIGAIEQDLEEEGLKNLEVVGDFAEVDQRTGNPESDVEHRDEDEERAEERKEIGDHERYGTGRGQRVKGE